MTMYKHIRQMKGITNLLLVQVAQGGGGVAPIGEGVLIRDRVLISF